MNPTKKANGGEAFEALYTHQSAKHLLPVYSMEEWLLQVSLLTQTNQVIINKAISFESDKGILAHACLKHVFNLMADDLSTNLDLWPKDLTQEKIDAFITLIFTDKRFKEIYTSHENDLDTTIIHLLFTAGLLNLKNILERWHPNYREKILAKEKIMPATLVRDALELNPAIHKDHLTDFVFQISTVTGLLYEKPCHSQVIELYTLFYRSLITHPRYFKDGVMRTPIAIFPGDELLIFSHCFLKNFSWNVDGKKMTPRKFVNAILDAGRFH